MEQYDQKEIFSHFYILRQVRGILNLTLVEIAKKMVKSVLLSAMVSLLKDELWVTVVYLLKPPESSEEVY